jgi:hypothetical protein
MIGKVIMHRDVVVLEGLRVNTCFSEHFIFVAYQYQRVRVFDIAVYKSGDETLVIFAQIKATYCQYHFLPFPLYYPIHCHHFGSYTIVSNRNRRSRHPISMLNLGAYSITNREEMCAFADYTGDKEIVPCRKQSGIPLWVSVKSEIVKSDEIGEIQKWSGIAGIEERSRNCLIFHIPGQIDLLPQMT